MMGGLLLTLGFEGVGSKGRAIRAFTVVSDLRKISFEIARWTLRR